MTYNFLSFHVGCITTWLQPTFPLYFSGFHSKNQYHSWRAYLLPKLCHSLYHVCLCYYCGLCPHFLPACLINFYSSFKLNSKSPPASSWKREFGSQIHLNFHSGLSTYDCNFRQGLNPQGLCCKVSTLTLDFKGYFFD